MDPVFPSSSVDPSGPHQNGATELGSPMMSVAPSAPHPANGHTPSSASRPSSRASCVSTGGTPVSRHHHPNCRHRSGNGAGHPHQHHRGSIPTSRSFGGGVVMSDMVCMCACFPN